MTIEERAHRRATGAPSARRLGAAVRHRSGTVEAARPRSARARPCRRPPGAREPKRCTSSRCSPITASTARTRSRLASEAVALAGTDQLSPNEFSVTLAWSLHLLGRDPLPGEQLRRRARPRAARAADVPGDRSRRRRGADPAHDRRRLPVDGRPRSSDRHLPAGAGGQRTARPLRHRRDGARQPGPTARSSRSVRRSDRHRSAGARRRHASMRRCSSAACSPTSPRRTSALGDEANAVACFALARDNWDQRQAERAVELAPAEQLGVMLSEGRVALRGRPRRRRDQPRSVAALDLADRTDNRQLELEIHDLLATALRQAGRYAGGAGAARATLRPPP